MPILLGMLSAGCAGTKSVPATISATATQQADAYLATQTPAIPEKAPWQSAASANETASVPPSIPVALPKDESVKSNAWLDSVRKANENIKFAKGYRVQVYSGPDRSLANKAKEAVYRHLDGQEVYLTYKQPDFKVHVGNYLNRLEATHYQNKLGRYFANILLVPEEVLLR